jgi:cytochrome c peroxidase
VTSIVRHGAAPFASARHALFVLLAATWPFAAATAAPPIATPSPGLAGKPAAPAPAAAGVPAAPVPKAAPTPVAKSTPTPRPTPGPTAGPTAPPAAPPPPGAVQNGTGAALTLSANGRPDPANPFFRPFGNGRSCASCHAAESGWSVTPESLARRFDATGGLDPVFRTVDGANTPTLPVATVAQRRSAYAMLLARGTLRIGRPIPAGAEFSLAAVDDPYGYATAAELSLFRRPLPTTNLKFATAVMWDSRETVLAASSPTCILGPAPRACFAPVALGLANQANDAVRGHAQASADLDLAQRQAIVGFESALITAQIRDTAAGALDAAGARGGPSPLLALSFQFGANDVVAGDYATRQPFNPVAMTLYAAWLPVGNAPPKAPLDARTAARQSIARGERLFDTRPFVISGVAGFNDELGQPAVVGTCTSCHDTPDVGTASVPRLMNTGVADAALRTPDLPLYTLRNLTTGATVQTTDPGYALTTGKWKDIGRMKVPSLRGLESRSPYFHNGFTGDLATLLQFYDRRFHIGLTPQETADLAAFLRTL